MFDRPNYYNLLPVDSYRGIPADVMAEVEITRDAFRAMQCDKPASYILLDVRSPKERDTDSIKKPGSKDPEGMHIHIETLRQWNTSGVLVEELAKNGINKDSVAVIYCRGGIRSYSVTLMLKFYGFKNVISLQGGLDGMRHDEKPKRSCYSII